MKIRTDFVTNSSSSSFIISKNVENPSLDIVFNIIKEFYKEYLDKRDTFKKECDKFGMFWDEKNCSFKFNKGSFLDSENKKVSSVVQETFGLSHWDYFYKEYDWLTCKTYNDYETYWVNKITADESVHAPFTIVDFSSTNKHYLVHIGKYGIKSTLESSVENYEDILGWYYPCAEHFLKYGEIDKECCDMCNCSISSKECNETVEKIESNDLSLSNALTLLLGKVCICSECGYIHDYVVNKLSSICSHYCNHMG